MQVWGSRVPLPPLAFAHLSGVAVHAMEDGVPGYFSVFNYSNSAYAKALSRHAEGGSGLLVLEDDVAFTNDFLCKLSLLTRRLDGALRRPGGGGSSLKSRRRRLREAPPNGQGGEPAAAAPQWGEPTSAPPPYILSLFMPYNTSCGGKAWAEEVPGVVNYPTKDFYSALALFYSTSELSGRVLADFRSQARLR